MSPVRLYLFGYPRMEKDGRAVQVDTRKAVALLAFLALSREAQSRETLAALLWPDYDQDSARGALRRTLSVLNKATSEECLSIDRERVCARIGAGLWCDVTSFEDALAQAAGIEGEIQIRILEDGLQWAHDRFMAGFSLRDSSEFDTWQVMQAERLGREQGRAYEKLSHSLAGQGRYEKAISAANRWLALDPLMEEAHRWLIQLYANSGQRGAALRQYRECVRILDQELGVAPLPETTEVYQAVLENRLSSTVGDPPAHSQYGRPAHAVNLLDAGRQEHPLVGRAQEMSRLTQVFASARTGLRLAILEGEAGIGKTRLAEEFLKWAQSQGARVIALRCYEGEAHLSYGPFVGWLSGAREQSDFIARLKQLPLPVLAEIARLLPEMAAHLPDLPTAASLDGPGAQGRFFDAVRQLLHALMLSPLPGVLYLDDIQWADPASLDLLAFLIRRMQPQALLVLATWRDDDQAGDPRLVQILHESRRAGALTRIPLGRLDLSDLTELAQANRPDGYAFPPDFSQRLYRETEGLPFFAVEYLDSFLSNPKPQGQEWETPASIRDLLRYRIAGIDETARQLMGAAAVIGRSFDLATLREVSGRSEMETITGLETLARRGLVIERPDGGASEVNYDFTHEKLRNLAYEETSLARRKLLHRRAAEVLMASALRPAGAGAAAALIARHYQAAGLEKQAAQYFKLAGDHERHLYASAGAITHYEAALASGDPDPAWLHEAIGDLRMLLGEYSAAALSYETAASLASDEGLAVLEYKLGSLHARMGEWDLAESHFQVALDSRPQGRLNHATVLAEWSQVAYQRGQPHRALDLATQALQQAESGEDVLVLAQAHNTLGILARKRGEFDRALAHLDRALSLSQSLDNPGVRIAALNNLAGVYSDMDRLEEAIKINQQALEACLRIGDRHREAALLNNLADLYHAIGDRDAAMLHLRQAVAIFTEIGVESGGQKPAIWNLSEW